MQHSATYIRKKFDNILVSEEWCFKNVRSTEQWTHGYHRYPAKFLPNIVKKLIEDYTIESDVIADLFAGCGTTLVEAKIHGRKSIGVDINPVAELITRTKTKPIDPTLLHPWFTSLEKTMQDYNPKLSSEVIAHDRIDYWFLPKDKYKINYLYKNILLIKDTTIRDFFLVTLSNILKNCSKWLQSSTKPQIDPDKSPTDPFVAFRSHAKQMMKKNKEFYDQLLILGFINIDCDIWLEDARKTSIKDKSVGAIITSPPYVTSYEYADIHQLTGYWYDYFSNLAEFRKNFIGTFYSLKQDITTSSSIGQEIVDALYKKDKRIAKEVTNYFNDMYKVAEEMYRILRPEGYACLVIGNTTTQDVKVRTAEVFTEILSKMGFKLIEIIKRSIPNKIIPTIRDKKTGRFSKLNNINSQLVYPEEYILIVQK